MLPLNDREKQVGIWSAALAIASVFAIFLASMLQANLLVWIIDKKVTFPILGGSFLFRAIVGIIAFFGSGRPRGTRTFLAFFYRDKWLSDRLRVTQPRSVIAVGFSLVFFKLAMVVGIIAAAVCVIAGVMLLGQAVSMFVVSTMLLVGYQAIAGSILLLR